MKYSIEFRLRDERGLEDVQQENSLIVEDGGFVPLLSKGEIARFVQARAVQCFSESLSQDTSDTNRLPRKPALTMRLPSLRAK